MRIIESFGDWALTQVSEGAAYPINNATNQTATGREKSMIDELNSLLQLASDPKAAYSQKTGLEPKILDFFSKSKCSIADLAIPKGEPGRTKSTSPNPPGMPVNLKDANAYSNAADWLGELINLGGSTNNEGETWTIKYEVGVMYFSLDDQGKITNAVLG
jgi:hypothetical protein